MFDETQTNIINAAMNLIMEKGYTATTTKDIASAAHINECTIFRRFKNKKEIVLSAMTLQEWNPCLYPEDFTYSGNLEEDLLGFSRLYRNKVTPRMVKVSIGLRTPELFADTADGILQVPMVFKTVLLQYFRLMHKRGVIIDDDFESMAMTFLSMNFGFVFLRASFGCHLTNLQDDDYIQHSVRTFLNGIAS